MTEKNFQAACIKAARTKGWICYKFASPARRGVPDVLMIRHGRVVFVEFKNPNGRGRLSPLQVKEIDTMRAAGAEVHVIDNWSDFDDIVNK